MRNTYNSRSNSAPSNRRSNSSRPRYSGGSSGGYKNTRSRGYSRGTYIDPQKFVNKAVAPKDEVIYQSKHKFADFGFMQGLQDNLLAHGYETPTAVQDQAIPAVPEGKDVIGLANTGTGKTAAFMLPIIQRLKNAEKRETALVIAPTRELAQQIDNEFRQFAKGGGMQSAICVGGMNIVRQIQELKRNPQVVIGTPGRLKDLINRKVLHLDKCSVVVLDEADHMLDMGFIDDINFIIDLLPENRQSLCFSATINPQIQRLLDTMLKDPFTVSVRTRETAEHINQDVLRASTKDEKIKILRELLAKPEFDKVLIFGETKHGVQKLADNLKLNGVTAEAIHGNKSQPQRQRALRAFKENYVDVLVATDVAARGLDIPNVSHVINFDQPANYSDYIHRIGRTGRAGKPGSALTFVSH